MRLDASTDGVLVVTINRPEARNAINTATARGDRRRRWTRSTTTARSSPGSSPAPAARSAPAWTSRRSSPASSPSIAGRGFAGHRRAAAGQAAHRGRRGLRPGRRVRDRAGLRPDRRRRGREVRPARGQARPGRRGRRAAPAPPAGALPPRDGVGADRRRDPGAARRTRPGWSTGSYRRRAARSTRRWRSPRRIAANGPLAVAATKRILVEAPELAGGGAVRPAAGDQRAGAVVRGRPRGRHRLQGEARRRAGRAAEPIGARTAISALLD